MSKVEVGTSLNHLEYNDRLMVFTSAMAITLSLRERSLQDRLKRQSQPIAARSNEVRKRLKGMSGDLREQLRRERERLVGQVEEAREQAQESKGRCTFYQAANTHCTAEFDSYHKYFRVKLPDNTRPQRDLAEAIYIRYRRQLERKAWRYLEKEFPEMAQNARAAKNEYLLDRVA